MTELLLCPFCGEKPTPVSHLKAYEQSTFGRFRCETFDCPISGVTINERAWNGRTPADPLTNLVSRFSAALLEKLRSAEAKGRHGWAETDWRETCQRGLANHVAKGDPRDVAAYCAFLWHHVWPTKQAGVNDLVMSICRMSRAEQYDLAFKIAENVGYVLSEGSELKRHKRLEDHDSLVARGEAEPF